MKDPGKKIHFWVAFAVVALLCVGGFAREIWQHDLSLTFHQIQEGIAWSLGALLAVGVAAFVIAGLLFYGARRKK